MGVSQINLVNNYYKPGPAAASLNFVQPSYNAIGIGKWYITGNCMNGNSGKTSDNWTGVDLSKIPAAQQASARSTSPFSLSGSDIPVQTAQAAYTATGASIIIQVNREGQTTTLKLVLQKARPDLIPEAARW